jgi:transposase-like protein
MSKKTRRAFTTKQKVEILRRHLKDKVPVSELCEEHQLQPSLFYEWQRRLLDNMEVALEAGGTGGGPNKKLIAERDTLKAKLAHKDSVIVELSQEYVTLKKSLGEP